MSGFVVRARRMDGSGAPVAFPNMSKNSDVKDLQKKIAASELGIPVERQRLMVNGKEMKAKDAQGHKYTLHDYQIQHDMVVMVLERRDKPAPLQEPNGASKAKADQPKPTEEPNAEEEPAQADEAPAQAEREPTPVFEEREPDEDLPAEPDAKVAKADDASGEPSGEGTSAAAGDDDVEMVETADGEKVAVPKEDKDAPPQVWCTKCKDNPDKRCLACSCKICHVKEEAEDPLICDECQDSFHLKCLELETVPEDDWFCPDCRRDGDEIVGAGADLKGSRKRKRGVNTKVRDWGKGMATASVDKRTDIDKSHVGAIPDVDVGQTWVFRADCASSGVHRPPVSGMHSKGTVCYSIVASHGYEDDADQGDEIWYTGEGGRDLSGNKRTNDQSKDQEWKRANLALAHSCAARFSPNGGDAGDNWRKGKPVRLVRGNKNKKASLKQAKRAAANMAKFVGKEAAGEVVDYLPPIPDLPNVKQIFRYDGTYKVVKYWQERGDSGFLICRFLLRRDDPVPAPWTEEGKALIASKGLSLKLPDGTVHCTGSFDVPQATKDLIAKDRINKAKWDEALAEAAKGKTMFIEKVKDVFTCDYCQDPMRWPVFMECSGEHFLCADCVKRAVKAKKNNPEIKDEKDRVVRCDYCAKDGAPLELDMDAPKPTIYEPLRDALKAII